MTSITNNPRLVMSLNLFLKKCDETKCAKCQNIETRNKTNNKENDGDGHPQNCDLKGNQRLKRKCRKDFFN